MIIKNGLLIDPVKEMTYVADLKIADGKIVEAPGNRGQRFHRGNHDFHGAIRNYKSVFLYT